MDQAGQAGVAEEVAGLVHELSRTEIREGFQDP
jgi:hypothetical protein